MKENWKLKKDNDLSNTKAKQLAEAIAICFQKAGFEISQETYQQLPEKYKELFN